MLKLYDVLSPTAPATGPFRGLLRVVAFSSDGVGVWLIAVPEGAWPPYSKKPFCLPRSEVDAWVAELRAVVTPYPIPPLWLMSDKGIRETQKQADDRQRCPALEKRDADFALIRDLVDNYSTAEILDGGLVRRWAEQCSRTRNVSTQRLYRNLNRYWAGACNRNALLPGHNQRAPRETPRKVRVKLGRRNAAAKAGHSEFAGFVITEDAIKKLQFGWETYKLRGTSVHDAFLTTSTVFWRVDTKKVDGKDIAVLAPAHARPTEAQFRYWGPKGDGNKEAWKTQLGVNEWERKHRPLPGSVRDGVVKAGQVATLDAVYGDVQLVSLASRLRPVGALTRITVLDSDIGYIAGFYAGFDAPSGATALQAIANAAGSKVEFCARYGIEITEDQWLPMAFKKYIADNGELRNELSMDAVTAWGASIEYVRSGRAELKHVESDHHSAQAKVDHKLPGTTLGRRAKRGEKDPVLDAALNHYEYVRLHIKRVLYHNNEERVPHLLTLEMREASVEPTRQAILKWKLSRGYATQFQPPVELLRARLLPEFQAVINRQGLFLMRPDRGNKAEIVRGARFVSDDLVKSGRMEKGGFKAERVAVNCDPNDLSRVWLTTPTGVMELVNVDPDSLLITRATLADVLDIQDDDAMKALLAKSETDQKAAAFNLDRDIEARAAVAARNEEMRTAGGAPSKLSLKRNRRSNRATEKALLAKPESVPADAVMGDAVPAQSPPAPAASEWSPRIALDQALEAALKARSKP